MEADFVNITSPFMVSEDDRLSAQGHIRVAIDGQRYIDVQCLQGSSVDIANVTAYDGYACPVSLKIFHFSPN